MSDKHIHLCTKLSHVPQISPALKADFDALLPAVQEAAAPCLKEKDVKKCIDGKLADLKKEYKDEEGKAALLDVLGKWHVDVCAC